jgi:hypothetical protein
MKMKPELKAKPSLKRWSVVAATGVIFLMIFTAGWLFFLNQPKDMQGRPPGSGHTPPGQALDFDGNDDYVTIADTPDLDITQELTLACWVKINASQSGYGRIISREKSGVWNRQYNLGLDS